MTATITTTMKTTVKTTPAGATTSGPVYRCGCPRRAVALVDPAAADELVRLYGLGGAVSRLAELSGLSVHATTDVLRSRSVQIRRSGGQRAPVVTTTFRFPPPVNGRGKHGPACKAGPENATTPHRWAGTERRGARVTHMVLVVGLVLAHEPNGGLWAREISKRADLKPKTVDRVLERMANDGWLTDEYEPTTGQARKARRFYRPTPRGLTALRAICDYAQHNAIYRRWLPAMFPVRCVSRFLRQDAQGFIELSDVSC